MEEYDLIRILIYGCSMMVGIVTLIKQFKLQGIVGSSTKTVSIGIFLISTSLLSQLLLSLLNIDDPIWNSISEIIILLIFTIGIGLAIYGLWKISIFFDELHAKTKQYRIYSKPQDNR